MKARARQLGVWLGAEIEVQVGEVLVEEELDLARSMVASGLAREALTGGRSLQTEKAACEADLALAEVTLHRGADSPRGTKATEEVKV